MLSGLKTTLLADGNTKDEVINRNLFKEYQSTLIGLSVLDGITKIFSSISNASIMRGNAGLGIKGTSVETKNLQYEYNKLISESSLYEGALLGEFKKARASQRANIAARNIAMSSDVVKRLEEEAEDTEIKSLLNFRLNLIKQTYGMKMAEHQLNIKRIGYETQKALSTPIMYSGIASAISDTALSSFQISLLAK